MAQKNSRRGSPNRGHRVRHRVRHHVKLNMWLKRAVRLLTGGLSPIHGEQHCRKRDLFVCSGAGSRGLAGPRRKHHRHCGPGIVLLDEAASEVHQACSYIDRGPWQPGRQELCEHWRFVLPLQQGLWSDLEQRSGVEKALLEVHHCHYNCVTATVCLARVTCLAWCWRIFPSRRLVPFWTDELSSGVSGDETVDLFIAVFCCGHPCVGVLS
jgi:hypothetical protein